MYTTVRELISLIETGSFLPKWAREKQVPTRQLVAVIRSVATKVNQPPVSLRLNRHWADMAIAESKRSQLEDDADRLEKNGSAEESLRNAVNTVWAQEGHVFYGTREDAKAYTRDLTSRQSGGEAADAGTASGHDDWTETMELQATVGDALCSMPTLTAGTSLLKTLSDIDRLLEMVIALKTRSQYRTVLVVRFREALALLIPLLMLIYRPSAP